MKILHLTLKKKWFDMILSGEKKEEYREFKAYWIKRLVEVNHPEESPGENKYVPQNIEFDVRHGHAHEAVLKAYYSKIGHFDIVRFRNGYSKDAPTMDVEVLEICTSKGRTEWGATNGTYFTIVLGEIISTENINK